VGKKARLRDGESERGGEEVAEKMNIEHPPAMQIAFVWC
jgi:hypothetical protein